MAFAVNWQVMRFSRTMADLNGALGSLPALHHELHRAVQAAVAFPLGALARSKLPRALQEFESAYAAWDAAVAQQLGAGRLAGVDGSKGTFWEAWSGGATEALLAKGDEMQKALEAAAEEWKEASVSTFLLLVSLQIVSLEKFDEFPPLRLELSEAKTAKA